MSTNDSGTADSGFAQQAPTDTGSASTGPSRKVGVETGQTGDVQQTGLGTRERANTSTSLFSTVGLSQAHQLLRFENTHLISLPTEYLWESYQLEDQVLTNVRQHLITASWLTENGGWDPTEVDRDQFDVSGDAFDFFPRLFNVVLGCIQRTGHKTPLVKTMMHSEDVGPESARDSTCQPDAFFHMTTDPAPMPDKFRWRDLTCPFEYKFGDGSIVNNDSKALWNLVNIVGSDPRRMFSFGCTIQGTKFRIWLLSRVAPFTFIPFDWFDDPDSLLKFFILLAASSETDLGLDTNIKRVGDTDSDLEFTIDGRKYCSSKLLYDVGTDALSVRGTRVFEVKDEETQEVRAIKDCWIEERHAKRMEHDIVAEIKRNMGDYQKFCKHFIDICGHRKTYTSGGFNRVCAILENGTFELAEGSVLQLLAPTLEAPKPTPTKPATERPPHPRFRYQVVYDEKGISLFEVASFAEAFVHIGRAMEGLCCLHEAGWVHRDFSPGNIIVAGTETKVSDLELAKQRAANRLEELTRPGDPSSPVARDIPTGTWYFTAAEVVEGLYLFLPDDATGSGGSGLGLPTRRHEGGEQMAEPKSGDDGTKSTIDHYSRIFLHNPLHDYESVWWIAVWFVFHCKPAGVADSVMEEARWEVDRDRILTLSLASVIRRACRLLPPVLRPLGEVLVRMRRILVRAYRSFEESFDGSGMLSVFEELKPCLQNLAELARGLVVAPPVLPRKLNIEELEFGAAALEGKWGQWGQQAIEQGGAGGSPMAVDDPSVGAEQDSVLGKRRRADSLPQVDSVLREKPEHEATAEP